jgi:hypothetical protein
MWSGRDDLVFHSCSCAKMFCDVESKMWAYTDGLSAQRGLPDFVPEGLKDRSQAIHCLEFVRKRAPCRRVRYDRCPGVLVIAFVQRVLGFLQTSSQRGTSGVTIPHTVPTGRVAFFWTLPGNKLPGYDHAVPSGQVPISPPGRVPTSPFGTNKPSVRGHVIDSTSRNIFEDEHEHEHE